MYRFNKEKLDQKTRESISNMERDIESSNKRIIDLKNELASLKDQALNKNKKVFHKSNEHLNGNQIIIFDEAEKYYDNKLAEPTMEEITSKKKKLFSYLGKKANLSNLKRITIEHKLDENKTNCDKCNGKLDALEANTKDVLKYKPAKLYIEEHKTYSYVCKACKEAGEKSNIITTKVPNSLLHKSVASNELVSHVISLKYEYKLPLYGQETYFDMLGANISRQTLSKWIIDTGKELEAVYNIMKEKLLESHYIQADDKSIVIVDSKGQDTKTKKYMWLYRTGIKKNPVILYDYQKTRSSTCPKEFLKGFSGVLQTDGYQGYNQVENVKRIYCLSHISRKYYDILSKLKDEELKNSKAAIGYNFCQQLYEIEKELKEKYRYNDDYFEKRFKIRLEKSAPIIEDFENYVDTELKCVQPKSPFTEALEYSKKFMPGFKIFLSDGSLEIDNNRVDRTLKTFILQKKWLMCNAPKGAKYSTIIYSIIETATANGLIIEKYLSYLMDKLSNLEIKDNDTLQKYMPWSDEIPESIRFRNMRKQNERQKNS
ncbi:MAG: IS66 family transposase [Bacillota bacterium]|nr:IS66 family transposase [Bacillota bacterium]